jgi:hypothetical protein
MAGASPEPLSLGPWLAIGCQAGRRLVVDDDLPDGRAVYLARPNVIVSKFIRR